MTALVLTNVLKQKRVGVTRRHLGSNMECFVCLCGGAADACQCDRGVHVDCLCEMLGHGHTKCIVCKADFDPQALA